MAFQILFIILFSFVGIVGWSMLNSGVASADEGDNGDEDNDNDGDGDNGDGDSYSDDDDNNKEPDWKNDPEFLRIVRERDQYKKLAEEREEDYNNLQKQLEGIEDPAEIKETMEAEINKLKSKNKNQTKAFQLTVAALAIGADPKALDDIVRTTDLESLETDDDGKIKDVKSVAKKLKEEKPYYFLKEKKNNIFGGGGGNPGGGNPGEDKYKDAADLAKNRANKNKKTDNGLASKLWPGI